MKKCWCGNTELAVYSSEYFKCEKCHTLITKQDLDNAVYDIKDEENDLYGKNYWEEEMTRVAGKNTLSEVVDMYLCERVIYWFQYVLKYIKLGGSVAEVGCGLGQLQYIMSRCGYNQIAFELSHEICEYMEKQLGIKTHCGPFEPLGDAYDGILAFDLFEHLIDPEEFLEYCGQSMPQNGILCFQTPCYDASLNYIEMQNCKPKFKEQLKEEQHIFLYSKESITEILNKHGFSNIIFEPAFFGDDYDMFFVASREPISTNSDKDIEDFLDSVPNGRLIKALITLFDRNNACTEQYHEADKDRKDRGEQIQELVNLLHESETDRAARLEQVQKQERLLKESEADRAARLEQVQEQERLLKESEADRAARLEQINTLSELLKESEADRAARLEQIITLTDMINSKQKK